MGCLKTSRKDGAWNGFVCAVAIRLNYQKINELMKILFRFIPKERSMKRMKQQSQTRRPRMFAYACGLLLVLLVALAMNGARAQQNALGAPTASHPSSQPASQTVAPSTGSPATPQVH